MALFLTNISLITNVIFTYKRTVRQPNERIAKRRIKCDKKFS